MIFGRYFDYVVVRIPEIPLYWSNNKMRENKAIKQTMTRDRHFSLLKYRHFSDNRINCQHLHSTVEPDKEVVMDEHMVPRHGLSPIHS